jgi:hypothetical protein
MGIWTRVRFPPPPPVPLIPTLIGWDFFDGYASLVRPVLVSGRHYLDATDRYMRLALKAQSQCRATLETLAEIKNPSSVAFVRQANIAHGPQQVNNSLPSRAGESEVNPNTLLEATHGERLDTGAEGTPGRADTDLEAVGAVNRAEKPSRQGEG